MKNMKYQSNVKTGYCRLCKSCHGRGDDEGGWCKGVFDRRVHAPRTVEEDNLASDAWKEAFKSYEDELYRGKIDIPENMTYPNTDAQIYEFFKTTIGYKNFDEKFPHYRASIPVSHFHSGNIVDDIALHGKLHFTEFIADVAINPLIDILEDVMEGHALVQVHAALDDKHLPHIAKRLKKEYEQQTLKTPTTRKDLRVESIRTSSYVSFLSKKNRSRKDLDERLERIISTASQLQSRSTAAVALIPPEMLRRCQELLEKYIANTVEAKRDFLVEIACNRQSPTHASAFMGGVMTFDEIQSIDEL